MRLDVVLAEKNALTRNKARQLIEVGLVFVNGKKIEKVSYDVLDGDILEIQEDRRLHWVSRSAEKLAGFLEKEENIDLMMRIQGSRCLDVGSSTGGFTQVLLEYGAVHVDAVDVGTDQLHESLRQDMRVSSYEQVDIRDFVPRDRIKNTSYDVIVCDASFISLLDILPSILSFADDHTAIILLYKPQFEVGKAHLRKTGVPKDEKVIQNAMHAFEESLSEHGCKILQKEKSTLIGEAGNQEWIYWIQK